MHRCTWSTWWNEPDRNGAHQGRLPSTSRRSHCLPSFSRQAGKHVWKTKNFLIVADMNELSETTAVSWDYITSMWAGCKASSYKDNAKEAFCFRKKFPSEGCLISVPAGCSHCKFTEWNWETLYWLQWVKNKIQVDSLGWSRKSVVNVIQVSSLKVR